MARFSPIRVQVHSDWYVTMETEKEMVKWIKHWEDKLGTDKFMELMYNMWKGFTKEEKEELRHRTTLLMKIVILRAHNYIASDFKQFKNPFAGRYRKRFTWD